MKKVFLLLGGWTRDQASYKHIITSAPSGESVYVVPHMALSLRNVEEIHSLILPYLQEHNVNKLSLVGHSLGGALAIEMAYRYPDLIEKLYLVDSEGVFIKEKLLQQFLHMLDNHLTYAAKKLKENLRATSRIIFNPMLYITAAKYAYTIDLRDKAKELKVPTVILWGERDKVTSLDQGELLHTLIPNSKLVVLKDMDHDWLLHNAPGFWSNM